MKVESAGSYNKRETGIEREIDSNQMQRVAIKITLGERERERVRRV